MKHRNWFWGLFFLLAAVFVVGSITGAFVHVGFWSIAATVLLAGVFIHSVIDLNYFGIFVPLVFLYKIYCNILSWKDVSIWELLLAAVLASIGFEILFHKHHHWKGHSCGDASKYSHITERNDDNHPYAKVSFGASSQYLHGDCIENGEFNCSFGAMEVFFDQALLSPSGAEIFLDCSFGAIKFFVPRLWQVKDNIHASLGAVDNDRIAQPDLNAPVLTLSGSVQCGAVEIHYV